MKLLLLGVLTLTVSCAHQIKLETVRGVTQHNRDWECQSTQEHDRDGKKIQSVLSYNYQAIEFHEEKKSDGSLKIAYNIIYPGSNTETSTFNSGHMQVGELKDGKQWVEDEWLKVGMIRSPQGELQVNRRLMKVKVLRSVDEQDNYVELEKVQMVDGLEVKEALELWSQSRKELQKDKFQVTRVLLNPANVQPGLSSWRIECVDEWHSP